MSLIHLLLEINCTYGWDKNGNSHLPIYCKYGAEKPGYHCIENECPFRIFTYADNEICFAGSLGEVHNVEAWVGFGGDMEDECNKESNIKLIEAWEYICKKKVSEAYDDFMKFKSSYK